MPPGRFLSDAEIERLEGWPEAIDPEDLARYFRLDGDDLVCVRQQHSPAGQLGVALQLCALRWLGFVPSDLTAAPPDVLAALSAVLDVSPRAIFDYAVRPQTRREHRPLVREHARFVAAGEQALAPVRDWLVDQALEHERPSLLFVELCVELRRRGVDRPAVNELMRIVGWARERAHELTHQRLAPQLTDRTRATLDGLLVTTDGHSQHAWLRQRPTSISATAMRRELDKRALLIETVSADRFDLSGLAPNRRAWLAQTGRQQTNQALARMTPERRYPVLMAFCVEALERCTDDALEVFDRALGAADRAAQRKRDEAERRGRRDIQTTLRRFVELSQVVLDAHDSGTDVMRLIERRIGIEALRGDLQRAQGVARPQATGHLAELISDHSSAGRKLLAGVIDSLELRASGADEDELLAAMALIRRIADDKLRWLPGYSPSAFIDAQWRAQVVNTARGRLDRRAYELCSAYELRSALRAGRVWVPGSRRHADPSSLMLPGERWEQIRSEFAGAVELPTNGRERLDALAHDQTELLQQLAQTRDTSAQARLDDGEIHVDHDEPEEGRLRALIEPMLPEVDIPELLIEVDGWTGFSEHLTPLSGNQRRSADMPTLLYAVILGQATNLGLTGMARASEFSYQQLEWAWEQLCREDTLTAASARLVDYHHTLPLVQQWGTGRLSSSDGQRFATRGRGPGTAALPRYFGHRRHGMQIYSWTSDQYSQYASKVITATVRDATHTLDGILDNQTVLPIEEHTTDTHGYTEIIFGAYDLLGLRFAPRIRDLDRQRLYRHGGAPDVETAELLKQKIRPELITPYWDELLRLAASLRHGWAPASLLLARLQAGSRRNPLAQALQEYGRLVKTNFILAWLADEELRGRVGRQLNKGEQLHALRRAIFHADEGLIRHRTPEQQAEQALCLSIVVNAIIAWNTVYVQNCLDQLRAAGELITSSEIEHISPLARQHIHLRGHYPFNLSARPVGHRPLRTTAGRAGQTAPQTPNRV
jgi:TnpA family transposase/methylmalonyl-CoA mutase cobalamin-binding subunit